MGLEPTSSWDTTRCFDSSASATVVARPPVFQQRRGWRAVDPRVGVDGQMVRTPGLEPRTSGFGNQCSIQLSYVRMVRRVPQHPPRGSPCRIRDVREWRSGAPGRSSTSGLTIRSRALCAAELRVHGSDSSDPETKKARLLSGPGLLRGACVRGYSVRAPALVGFACCLAIPRAHASPTTMHSSWVVAMAGMDVMEGSGLSTPALRAVG